MTCQIKFIFALVLFCYYSTAYPGDSLAQGAGAGAGSVIVIPSGGTAPAGRVQSRRQRRLSTEFNIHVDAMAIIADWRARQPQSHSGTPRRSGVTINGTAVGRVFSERAVLFSCPGVAFLELEYSVRQANGASVLIYGPLSGCAPRQGLVLSGGRLSCQWYTPPVDVHVSGLATAGANIVLPSNPPITIAGECITEAAHVVPAQAWPQGGADASGAAAGSNRDCNASGVTVNGRATGHSAGCRR